MGYISKALERNTFLQILSIPFMGYSPFSDTTDSNLIITFNSLYGIPLLLEELNIKVFQPFNSLYGIQLLSSFALSNQLFAFQFPLWDTTISYILSNDYANFQFPLWDTKNEKLAETSGGISFQFPLWDTTGSITNDETINSSLSIPFMGYFHYFFVEFLFQFLSFNSLYGIPSRRYSMKALSTSSFQFPLWDTTPLISVVQRSRLSIPFMGYTQNYSKLQ